jgi:hypothetical protein
MKQCSIFDIFNTFNFSTSPSFSGSSGACIMVETDGTLYGYKYNSFGSIEPAYTKDGVLVHQYTTDVNGNFVISFGTSGSEKLLNVDELYVKDRYFRDTIVLNWDASSSAYIVTDYSYGQKIIQEYNNIGTFELCISVRALPKLFIHYTFDSVETGDL